MKHLLPLAACLLILGSGLPVGAERDNRLRRGDEAEKILEVLGEPNAFIESKQRGVYYYDRGEVHTRDGKVSIVRLMRPAELEELQEAEREERRRRKAEGERKLAEILENELFPSISAAERVVFWKRFQGKYPGVDIEIHLAEARMRARGEAKEAAEEARMVRLEQRVRRAEREAADARREAEAARRLTERGRRRSRDRYIVLPHAYRNSSCRISHHQPGSSLHHSKSLLRYPRGRSAVLNSNIDILKQHRTSTFGGGGTFPSRNTRRISFSFTRED